MRIPLAVRRIVLAVAIVGGLLAVALWPSAIPVDVVATVRGPLVTTIREEGQTRVCDRYVVSSPVAGRVLRIDLDPGDRVARGQVIARVRAVTPPLLDARTRAQAEAAIESARAALGRARAEEQRSKAELTHLKQELARAHELAKSQLVARQEVDSREAAVATGEESVRAATYAVGTAGSELQRAQAQLNPAPAEAGRVVSVASPVDGVVLKRVRESESVVPAGDPLLEIGNPRQLEIVADLLSTDAVRVVPGARATIDQWGGPQPIDAKVRRVEPAGFTKISALGVEEQRVNVILDFRDPATAWAALGDAYRVEVNIVTWEATDVLKAPTGALFRVGSSWAVYVLDGNRVRQRLVTVGHQNGREAEITDGLTPGVTLVVNPPDTLTDGSRIRIRSTSPTAR